MGRRETEWDDDTEARPNGTAIITEHELGYFHGADARITGYHPVTGIRTPGDGL